MAKSLEEIEAEFRVQFKVEEYIEEGLAEEDPTEENLAEENPVKEVTAVLGEPEKNEKRNRAEGRRASYASIISDIIFYFALFIMVLCAVIFTQGNTVSKGIGGYRFYVVETTSMQSIYPKGSLVITKTTDPNSLIVGDDITFYKDSVNTITHRIIEIQENYEGTDKRAFTTKGVDNAFADTDPALADNVAGKVLKGIPYVGAAVVWLGANLWILLLFVVSMVAFSFFIKIFWRESRREKREKKRKAVHEMIEKFKNKTEEKRR